MPTTWIILHERWTAIAGLAGLISIDYSQPKYQFSYAAENQKDRA